MLLLRLGTWHAVLSCEVEGASMPPSDALMREERFRAQTSIRHDGWAMWAMATSSQQWRLRDAMG